MSTGQPDWAAAIEQAQSVPPAVDTPALQKAAARRAQLVAKLAGHPREA